jgi:hypothetical protein
MDDAPLLHEPGIRDNHADFAPYNRIIEFKTIEFAMCALLNDAEFDRHIKIPAASKAYFYPLMRELFRSRRDKVVERVSAMCEKYGSSINYAAVVVVSIYSMTCAPNYTDLLEKVKCVSA